MKRRFPRNPLKVTGYEKFWASLLAGSGAAAVATLVKWPLAASTGAIPMPSAQEISAAIDMFLVALASALGAYFATNSGTYTVDALSTIGRTIRDEIAPQEHDLGPRARPDE